MKQNWSLTSASLHDHDSEHGFTFPVHKQKHSKDGREDLQGTKPGKHVTDFEVAFPNPNGSIYHLKCYRC